MVLLLLLGACNGSDNAEVRANPANRKPGYFDVKGFLDSQIAQLNRRQPALEKRVRLRDGAEETTRVTKTDWSKELQIFYQADINKPALRGAYAVAESAPHGNAAGQGQRAYVRKPGVEAPVEQLTINTMAGAPKDQVEDLTAVIKQDNPLFYAEKKLRLRSRNGMVAEYEVQGVQKLVMFDTVRYSVRTRVLE